MNNRIVKYLIFIVVVVATDQLCGSLISKYAKKHARDNRIELLINDQINSDLFIIGSSRALNNYDPETISKITKLKSYNLGVSGSNIIFHELILDLILQSNNKPKYVIYNVDDYGTLFKMDGIVFRKDVIAPYVNNSFINKVYCEQTGKNLYATLLMSTYRQNINFINAVKYLVNGRDEIDYKTTNFDQFGANLLKQRKQDPVPVYGSNRADSMPTEEFTEHVNSLIRIQQKCSDQDVQLIICIPPLYTKASPNFKQLLSEKLNQDVYLIDFTNQLQNSEYFFNNDHMNISGAVKFSEMLSNEINQLVH